MTSTWTDERLDRFADKVDRIADKIDQQGEQIGRLIEALYLQLHNIKAEIHSIGEEAEEQRETLHAELVEIKEITRQQAIVAQTQAESIRLMIEMVNRKQA
jgi:predicted HicB family RNase H-like nuclease